MHFFRHLFLALFFGLSSHASHAEDSKLLNLRGHLGQEKLQIANKILREVESDDTTNLIIFLDSSSGDLKELLKTAKEIYRLKTQKSVKVTVYIEDNAVGPAAIIPFLANDLYISYLVLWGDIPLGTEGAFPTNLLRSQVSSLITSQEPFLKTLAAAMSDPDLIVILDKTLRLSSKTSTNQENVASDKGETLVLNQNQLKTLDLVKGTLSLNDFRDKIELTQEQKSSLQESSDSTDTPQISKGDFNEELAQHITYSTTEKNRIGHIYVGDRSTPISQSTWIYVKSALDYYKKTKPAFIILELNTPGGEVFASQKISDLLREIDNQFNIPVVVFIDNWAISAGAMLAYSCRFITTVKDGSIGAAEPVLMGEGGKMQSASEKINSALRTDFGNRAGFFDRDPNIAKAMVDKDIILVLRHGKIVKLDSKEQIRLKGPNPDKIITDKGKLLTLNAQEMLEYGVADLVLPPTKISKETSQEKTDGRWAFSKELLSTYPYFKEIPNASIDAYRMDWRTKFFSILATPMVASLLMLGMLVGFYLEFNTPGFGLPGAVGLTCLVLIVISNLSLEIASLLEVILMLIGIGLILAEFSILPTGGVLGLIGAVFFIGGLFAVMLPGIGNIDFELDTQTVNAAGQEFLTRLAWLCGTIVVGFGVIAVLAQYVTPSLAGLNRLVLSGDEQDADKGFIAGDKPENLPSPGSAGEVLATLRPAGKVIIDQKIYDAVTAGGFIEKGKKIVVERLDGSVIVVMVETKGNK